MPRKSKLNQLNVTHGEVVTRQPSGLDELLGYKGISEYRFLNDPFDDQEYEKYLNNLATADLAEHCQKFGLIHTDNKKMTINKLLAEFQLHRSRFRPKDNVKTPLRDVTVEKIMSAAK